MHWIKYITIVIAEESVIMPRWRNRVEIKKYLFENLSDFEVKLVSETLLPQLKSIYKKEALIRKRNPVKAVKYQLISDLEDVISNLEWIIAGIDNKENTEDCSFKNWAEALESELTVLDKLGRKVTRYECTYNENEHFLQVI